MSNRLKDLSYGIASQESASMHKLAKMLLEQPFSRKRVKMQALRYLIAPHQLAQRQVHKYGWISAIPIQLLTPKSRTELAEAIRTIEADENLTPYERVGKIVETIKKTTKKKFINDSAFRTMMNMKFNEYVLADHIDEIYSVEDALRVMREADVEAKPTTLLGAYPEIFSRNRLTAKSPLQIHTSGLLGGRTHQSSLTRIASYVQTNQFLRQMRFRVPAKGDRLPQIIETVKNLRLASKLINKIASEGNTVLHLLRRHMPQRVRHITTAPGLDPSKGDFAGCSTTHSAKTILRKAYADRSNLTGFFNNPVALTAVAEIIEHQQIADRHLARDHNFQISDQRQFEDWVINRIASDPLRFEAINHPLMDTVKQLRLDSASSYDTLLVDMARYRFERRQPMVFAIDRLLGIDSNCTDAEYRREAAAILKGASTSLFPSNLTLMEPNEVLRSETREAVHRHIGGESAPDGETKTWLTPGGRGSFHTPSGMPHVVGLPVGVKDLSGASMTYDSSFDLLNSSLRIGMRNREALLQYDAKQHAKYKLRHQPPDTVASEPPKASKQDNNKPRLRLDQFKSIEMAVLATGLHATSSAAQEFLRLMASRKDVHLNAYTVRQHVESMNFDRATLNAKDAFGNNALHEALRLEDEHYYAPRILGRTAATAFEESGASYGARNFYGVPLTELIPLNGEGPEDLAHHSDRVRVARASAMSSQLFDVMSQEDDEEPVASSSGSGFVL